MSKPRHPRRTRDIRKKAYPYYTIAELAELLDIHYNSARNMLERTPVRYAYVGRKIVVTLSDIREGWPELYDSIINVIEIESRVSDTVPPPATGCKDLELFSEAISSGANLVQSRPKQKS